MQRVIKNLLKDSLFFIAIGITIIIAYLSLIPVTTKSVSFTGIDKVFHLLAYFTLGISWLTAFYRKTKYKYAIIILCIVYGIIIEILQSKLTNYRTGDYLDILANTLGIFLALFLFNQILKKISIKKQ
ncbi:VanZ family protein [Polaribacter sp. WD7]|uniref:VanZ family protein n=1 Tax=Polaribacter sp. WD7 TaxID=2269061 RepID=UPI0015F0AA6A|nr:VanZ family protein [Polaribacter sp. WD7]